MLERRFALAALAATILVAGAIVAPIAKRAGEERALESTASLDNVADPGLGDLTTDEGSGQPIVTPVPIRDPMPVLQSTTTVYVAEAFGKSFVVAMDEETIWRWDDSEDAKPTWEKAAIAAAAGLACPHVADEADCEETATLIATGMARALPQEVAGQAVPQFDEQVKTLTDILGGISIAVAPTVSSNLPTDDVIPTTIGVVAGLVPEHSGDESLEAISQAVTTAVLANAGPFLPEEIRVVAEETAAQLADAIESAPLTGPEIGRLANDSVARAALIAEDTEHDIEETRDTVKRFFLDPIADPTVRVSDGVRTLMMSQLDGSLPLDGLQPLRFYLSPTGGNTPVHENWQLFWHIGPQVQERQMGQDPDGTWRTTVMPAEIRDAPRGQPITFYFAQVVGTVESQTEVRREGSEFAFIPDRDVPVVLVDAPNTVSLSSFDLDWEGTDGDTRIVSYRVDVREGTGSWTTWIQKTQESDASFTGEPGKSYTFRVTALDEVEHSGVGSALTQVSVPPSAPPNRPPTVSIRGPVGGSVHTTTIPVDIAAGDPDGTVPLLRLCLRKATSGIDLVCPVESKNGIHFLDATELRDGHYRLHVLATDGTRTSEATSDAFTIDRTPPGFRGASIDATPSSAVLTAALDGAATRVIADVGGRIVTLFDNGQGVDGQAGDDVWTAQTALPVGQHDVLFHATDENGNEATLDRTVVVSESPAALPADDGETPPLAQPPAPLSDDAPSGTPPEEDEATGEKGTPAPAAAWVLLALAGVAMLARRRRA